MGDASCDSRKIFTEFILQHSAGISHYSCLHKDLLDRSYMRENAFTYTVIAAWQMYRLCSQPLRKLLCCKKPISFLFVFESEDILTPWEYMADNISTKVFWWVCSPWWFLINKKIKKLIFSILFSKGTLKWSVGYKKYSSYKCCLLLNCILIEESQFP